MEMNRNPYITKGINGLHMEIGEHGVKTLDEIRGCARNAE